MLLYASFSQYSVGYTLLYHAVAMYKPFTSKINLVYDYLPHLLISKPQVNTQMELCRGYALFNLKQKNKHLIRMEE